MVLQGIIDRLKGARELTIKRLYKLVLRKALGNFLAGQLGVDQLDVKLIILEDTPSSPGTSPSSTPTRQGYVQLTDLEVNSDALNVYLATQPFKLHKGRIGKVEVTVCYEKLLTEGFKIVLEDVELVVVRRKPEEGDESGRKGVGGIAEVRRRKEEEEKAAKAKAKASSSSSSSSSRSSSSSSSEDASIIAEWIEQITTQLRVEVKGLRVRIVEGSFASLPLSFPSSLPPFLPPFLTGWKKESHSPSFALPPSLPPLPISIPAVP